ncbi:MAG: thioredoxin family protein [Rubrivivax sp.]|nr:thioredoxin family protein [Rubrivivax sp.]
MALEIVPYSDEAREHARQANAPVALHFHSRWCATCRQQRKVFEQLRDEPGLDLKLLVVDFDDDGETVRAFRVGMPGVLIVMRGDGERARLAGVVARDELAAALRKAL